MPREHKLKGENIGREFKIKLREDYHLKNEKRKASLKNQILYKVSAAGSLMYLIGVADNGELMGISYQDLLESDKVLKKICSEIPVNIEKEDVIQVGENRFVKCYLITRKEFESKLQHLTVIAVGHVGHGKSTLIASLITGKPDDGSGKLRVYLFRHPHEIKRGLTADLSLAFYAFNEMGEALRFSNPKDPIEQARILQNARKIVSFVDNVGHLRFFKTMVRGFSSMKPDYAMLTVSAVDGLQRGTLRAFLLLISYEIPFFIVVTKIDRVSEEAIAKLEEQIILWLKRLGKTPYRVKDEIDVSIVASKMPEGVVPIIRASSVTMEGLSLIDKLLWQLKPRVEAESISKPFLMYIDEIYNIVGVGPVVSGKIKWGKISKGDIVLVGPVKGEFVKAKVLSIEKYHQRISVAYAGDIIAVALKPLKRQLKYRDYRRGMVVCDQRLNPKPVKRFVADVRVYPSPTTVKEGYCPVLYCESIRQQVKIEKIENIEEHGVGGFTATITASFIYRPCFIQPGDRFVLKEHDYITGVGVVKSIFNVQ